MTVAFVVFRHKSPPVIAKAIHGRGGSWWKRLPHSRGFFSYWALPTRRLPGEVYHRRRPIKRLR